jgi:hypothetical protein
MKADALPKFKRAEWVGFDLTSVLKKHRPLFLLLLDGLERKTPGMELGALLCEAGNKCKLKKYLLVQ